VAVESSKKMSDSDEKSDSDSETQIGGGRPSVESVCEFLKEFKSARMSFEPLDTWLFVKARDNSSSDTESVSDTNNVSASSESDSSVVYHFDSDEVSSNDDVDADAASYAASTDAVDDRDKACDKRRSFIVKNLASSPGRSGGSVKVFSEADQSDVLEEEDCSFSDAFCLRNEIESFENCITVAQEPELNSFISTNTQSRVCIYDTYKVLNDCLPVTRHHESITCLASKCPEDDRNACDILDKSSSEKPSEFGVDGSSVSHRHANHRLGSIESPARTVCDDSTAECDSSDIDTKADMIDTLKRNKKRQRIAQELMDTEATYQQHLELIVQVYNLLCLLFLKILLLSPYFARPTKFHATLIFWKMLQNSIHRRIISWI